MSDNSFSTKLGILYDENVVFIGGIMLGRAELLFQAGWKPALLS